MHSWEVRLNDWEEEAEEDGSLDVEMASGAGEREFGRDLR